MSIDGNGILHLLRNETPVNTDCSLGTVMTTTPLTIAFSLLLMASSAFGREPVVAQLPTKYPLYPYTYRIDGKQGFRVVVEVSSRHVPELTEIQRKSETIRADADFAVRLSTQLNDNWRFTYAMTDAEFRNFISGEPLSPHDERIAMMSADFDNNAEVFSIVGARPKQKYRVHLLFHPRNDAASFSEVLWAFQRWDEPIYIRTVKYWPFDFYPKDDP